MVEEHGLRGTDADGSRYWYTTHTIALSSPDPSPHYPPRFTLLHWSIMHCAYTGGDISDLLHLSLRYISQSKRTPWFMT